MKGKVTSVVAELVIERDFGTCVARCAPHCRGIQQQLHHRRARGMGSTNRPESNSAANLISLCRSCHEWIESNRTEALEHGWLVPQAQEPAEVDIWWRGKKARLDDLGGLVLL